VKYSVRKVLAGTTTAYEGDVWEVLKTPSSVDPYIIAAFPHPSLALWCLGCFHSSIEVQKRGGSVEEPALDPIETVRKIPFDMPDELVW
jgi:hypothetical protein